jgi:ketosteroid isomerase-like protein
MRSAVFLLALFSIATLARADDVADVKEAFLKYQQASFDNDIPAMKARSTGDATALKYQDLSIERNAVMKQLWEATYKLPDAPKPPPTSKPDATAMFNALLARANVEVSGDSAKITPEKAPFFYGFKKVDGTWKADLNRYAGEITPKMVAYVEAYVAGARAITARIEGGELKTYPEVRAALTDMDTKARASAETAK